MRLAALNFAACSTTCYNRRVPKEINQRQLRNRSGEVMRGLDGGETFIVTRNGVPVGELRPLVRRDFAKKRDVIDAFRNAPPVDFASFRRDLDAIADPRA